LAASGGVFGFAERGAELRRPQGQGFAERGAEMRRPEGR